jgi:ferredoxin
MLYFSGSGNTAYLVHQLEKQWADHSIAYETFEMETFTSENVKSLESADYILFAYPVFGSMAPMIVWRFVKEYAAAFKEKKGAVVATQSVFSGDGGAYLARILKKCDMEVVSIEHFKMPNSRSDRRGFKPLTEDQRAAIRLSVNQKVELYAMDFAKERFYKIGDNFSAMLLGAFQRIPFSKLEKKLSKDVKFDWTRCTACGLCTRVCPVQNLTLSGENDLKVTQANQCVLCYRCVNQCPERAISIFSKTKPRWQYRGIE